MFGVLMISAVTIFVLLDNLVGCLDCLFAVMVCYITCCLFRLVVCRLVGVI